MNSKKKSKYKYYVFHFAHCVLKNNNVIKRKKAQYHQLFANDFNFIRLNLKGSFLKIYILKLYNTNRFIRNEY